MGFINNTSNILNAVLTKKGKQYLAKSDGKFNITKFALADDEIDYTLWDTAHPKGTDYYGAVLESTPMIEPCVDPEVVMKYKLFTMPFSSTIFCAPKRASPATFSSTVADWSVSTRRTPTLPDRSSPAICVLMFTITYAASTSSNTEPLCSTDHE